MKAQIVYQPLKTTEVTNAPATIDIDEPIRLYRGEFTTVSFRYFPGDPPGNILHGRISMRFEKELWELLEIE